MRRTVRVLLVVVLAVALAGLPLYVFPRETQPRRSDVVLVLGPPKDWKFRWAEQLVDEGLAGAVMASVRDADRTAFFCEKDLGVEVLCRRPDPYTTRGEARWLQEEMAAHGWDSALVLTGTPHVRRARFVIGRCVPDGVQVVGRSDGLSPWRWVYQYGYQSAGWVRALAQRGC